MYLSILSWCRYTQNTLGPIEYGATHPSIANLGSSNWTIAGDNYCFGNGFVGEVCLQDGYGNVGSAWEYACGRAAAEVETIERSIGRFIFGGLVSLQKK